jgi:WD40 repeat protein
MNTATACCPHCRRPLPPDAPHGQCPVCLTAAAVGPWAEEAPDPLASESRARLGDFELLEELGRGGTGTVWQARQLSLNRRVALKLLALPALSDEEARQRFEREAQAIAALHHPNIVQIYEIGAHEGRPFFVMELIAGGNLSARLRGALPATRQAAGWLRALAQAVAHAHSRGVIHRDLKPANILLDASDKPFLTDFGLAKVLGTESDLTLTGLAVGSAPYMAPEQAEGRNEAVGPAADIHALGAVLYQMLTGRPPFLAGTLAATLKQVADTDPVPPRKLNPSAPRDLETICLKCLEKLPARRYASAQDLADDLERFLNDQPIRARPVPFSERVWRACRHRPLVSALSAALLLTAVGGVATVTMQWRKKEAANARLQEHLWQGQLRAANLQIESDVTAGLAAHAALLRAAPHLHTAATRLLFALSQLNFPLPLAMLEHPAEVRWARFSPDGRHIATVCADHQLRLWDARNYGLRAGPRGLAGPAQALQFSADGRWLLVASSQDQVELCVADTLQPQFVPAVGGVVGQAAISEDGRVLLVRERDGRVSLWDTTREATAPILQFTNTVVAALSPSGQFVAIAGTNQTVQVWEVGSGEPACGVWNMAEPVLGLRFAPQNRRVAIVMSSQVRLWHLADARPSGYLAVKVSPAEVCFSPDGQRLLVSEGGLLSSLNDSVTGRRLLDFERRLEVLPDAAFSPEGLRILACEEQTRFGLLDVLTGRNASRPVRLPANITDLSISPDGRRVLAAAGLKSLPVWEVSMGAISESSANHEGRLHTLAFSRNGQRLLTAGADGTARLWDAHTLQPATPPLSHADAVWSARFSQDDTRILTASRDGTARLWSTRTGEPVAAPLAHALPVHVGEFSPDGRTIATVTADGVLRCWKWENGEPIASPAGSVVPLLAKPDPRNEPSAAHLSPSPLNRERFPRTSSRLDPLNPVGTRSTASPSSGLQLGTQWNASLPVPAGRFMERAGVRGEAGGIGSSNSNLCSGQFSPDGQRFMVVSASGEAVLWDVAAGTPIAALPHPAPVTAARFSPDGARLATACRDGWVRLWNPTNGLAAGHPLAHQEAVLCLAFAPDGWRLAAGGADCQPRLWDTRTSALLRTLPKQDSPVIALAFNPDGAELATFTAGHLGRVWDTAFGLQTSGRFSGQRGAGVAIAFSPDGRWLACGMAPGGLRLFEHPAAPVPVPGWLPELANALARLNPETKGQPLDDAIRAVMALRQRLQALPGDDFYARWGRWFAADRATRTASPHSPLTVPQLVERFLQQNTSDSLHEAMRLMPDDPRCAIRLADWLAKNRSPMHPQASAGAAFCRRRAAELEALAKLDRPAPAPPR